MERQLIRSVSQQSIFNHFRNMLAVRFMNLKIELLQLKLAAKFGFKISEYPSLFIVLLRETDFSTILRLQKEVYLSP